MAMITPAQPPKWLAVDSYGLGITQLAAAVLFAGVLLVDELESELVELLSAFALSDLAPSDFAGSLAVDEPPRLSVR
jgi:hypothetical protein